jgi:hypothetical protein
LLASKVLSFSRARPRAPLPLRNNDQRMFFNCSPLIPVTAQERAEIEALLAGGRN